jgi:hypothetical protein
MSTVEFVDEPSDDEVVEIDLGTTQKATKPEKGICRVCGKPARSLTGTVCDDHDGRRKGGNRGPRIGSKPGSRSAAPSATDWSQKVFAKVVVALTYFLAIKMISDRGIHDPNDQLAEGLGMTNEEAVTLTAPLGRLVASTEISKKHGRKVLENIDIFDAMFAFWDWQKRVNAFLSANQHRLATVQPIRTTGIPMPPVPEKESNNEPSEEDAIPEYGFGDSTPNGEHFVL